MAEETSSATHFYAWQASGKPIVAYLSFGVIDRIAEEALRGLAALPRRGAEVGGILLGTAQRGDKVVVKIVDCVPVLCGHYFGPSYVLTHDEKQAFQQVLAGWRPSPSRNLYAVGYYRSHTRDGLFLSDEDVWLMSTYFADPSRVALLVKPHTTCPSVGGFFFWEQNRIRSESSYAEFPFDPVALHAAEPETVAETPAPATAVEAPAAAAPEPAPPALVESPPTPMTEPAAEVPEARPAAVVPEPEPESFSLPSFLRTLPPRRESRQPFDWKDTLRWAPIFLLLALLGGWLGTEGTYFLGVGAAPSSGPQADPYTLRLAVSEYGDNLHLTWDRQAPALRQAQRGLLIIGDGEQTRTLELDSAQLRRGSVIYRRLSSSVRFRLELYLTGNRTLSEAWEPPPAQPPAGTAPPPR